MILNKTLLGAALAAGLVALPLSAAQAYPCNPVTGLFGAAATVAGAAVTIGTAPLSPIAPLSQPYWKIAVSTPYAAPIESTLMSAA